jgi:hypothetical protein
MKNSLAGTSKGKSESAKYFQSNSDSRKKKNEYNKEYHATPERKKYRVRLNKANRDAGSYGNKDGNDMSHTKNGNLVKESQSSNRSRNGRNGSSTKK